MPNTTPDAARQRVLPISGTGDLIVMTFLRKRSWRKAAVSQANRKHLRWTVHSDLNRLTTAGRLCSAYVASRVSVDCNRPIAAAGRRAGCAAHKRPAPRWHGYGFLPGYHQPPNDSLPAYAQKASVSRMARHNRRPWYIDPIPSLATGTISAGLAFTAVATMAAASALAG